VQSTKRHAEGTAVGFNKEKKGARSYYPLFCTVAATCMIPKAGVEFVTTYVMANKVYLLCSLLAHNLSRELQMQVEEPVSAAAPLVLAQRLALLGATAAADEAKRGLSTLTLPKQTELLGANETAPKLRALHELISWIVILVGQVELRASSCCPAMGSATSLEMLLASNSAPSLARGWALMLATMMAPMLVPPIYHIRISSFARRRPRSIALQQ
jgi:hypothetical protein